MKKNHKIYQCAQGHPYITQSTLPRRAREKKIRKIFTFFEKNSDKQSRVEKKNQKKI